MIQVSFRGAVKQDLQKTLGLLIFQLLTTETQCPRSSNILSDMIYPSYPHKTPKAIHPTSINLPKPKLCASFCIYALHTMYQMAMYVGKSVCWWNKLWASKAKFPLMWRNLPCRICWKFIKRNYLDEHGKRGPREVSETKTESHCLLLNLAGLLAA